MKEILFKLTHTQRIVLRPLWVRVDSAFHDNEKRAVFMQARENGVVSAIFVPQEQATKVLEILKELK